MIPRTPTSGVKTALLANFKLEKEGKLVLMSIENE
jgi:hypothetical protein